MRQPSSPYPLRLFAVSAVLVLAAACGGSGTSAGSSSGERTGSSDTSSGPAQQDTSSGATGPPSTPHNRADASFAGAMVALEARTAQAAGLADPRSHSAPVRALGQEIERSQTGEAKKLDALLTAWGEQVPNARVPGLPSQADLGQLLRATGISFDRLWLRLMTNAEQGELTLAETELRHGANSDVLAVAREVVPDRRITVERMHGLLADKGD